MKDQQSISDPVFGRLDLGTFWVGQATLPAFGGDIHVSVDTSEASWLPCKDPPSDAQRRVFSEFLRTSEGLFRPVETALFHYYQEVRPAYCDGRTEDEIREEVPEIVVAPEIWRLLSNPTVEIPHQGIMPETLYLQWKCTWDWNREVEVVVKDGEVKAVRTAGDPEE